MVEGALDAYAMGWPSCRRTAPNPLEFASTDGVIGWSGLKYCNTGTLTYSSFSLRKLFYVHDTTATHYVVLVILSRVQLLGKDLE